MGARAWSADNYIPATYNGTSGTTQTMMWSLYNFFVSLTSSVPQLGLSIIAWQRGNNTGYVGGGTLGNNRFDQPAYFGSNSFFVVRFASASNPFEILFQLRTNTNQGGGSAAHNFGASPGNPGLLEGLTFQAGTQTDQYLLAWAVSMRLDSSRSWNGTTASNGLDTKSSPVWTGSVTNGFYLFPRNNSPLWGGTGTNRENCMWLVRPAAQATAPCRWHIYCDTDSFFFTHDFSDDGTYERYNYFGPYTPLSAANVMPTYVCITDSAIQSNRFYGFQPSTNPIDTTNYPNGGVIHPVASGSGTMAMVMGVNNTFASPMFPANIYGGTSPKIFNSNYTVGVRDDGMTNSAGYVGTLTNIFTSIGMSNEDVSGSFAAFGTSNTANTTKYIIPWPTGVLPGTNVVPFANTTVAEVF